MRLRRLTVLAASVAIALAGFAAAPPAQAAALGMVVWDGSHVTPDSLPSAVVTDTFDFDNSTGGTVMVVNSSGTVSIGGQTCLIHACYVSPGSMASTTVTALGSIEIIDAISTLVVGTITVGGGSSSSGDSQSGGPTAPVTIASQPPTVVATPGDGLIQLAITPGTGGTGAASKFAIEYEAADPCLASRAIDRPITELNASTGTCCYPATGRSVARVIAPVDNQVVTCCPRSGSARALAPRPVATDSLANISSSLACMPATQSMLVDSASPTGVTTVTIPDLRNNVEYQFSVKEMTTDQLWSGASTASATPSASIVCTTLSVDVTQPDGLNADPVTPLLAVGSTPTTYPFIAPPYGGVVKTSAKGSWNGTSGSAGGEYAVFTPRTEKPCALQVDAPDGVSLATRPGIAWNSGSHRVTAFAGQPVFVYGTKAGEHSITFTSVLNRALQVTAKVRIGTVPQAAYSIAVTPATQSLAPGSFGAITSTVTDAFGNPVPGAVVEAGIGGEALFAGYTPALALQMGDGGSATTSVIASTSAGTASVRVNPTSDTTAWAWQAGYVTPAGFPDPVKSAGAAITVQAPAPAKSITITDAGRTDVSGKPGVYARGRATGFVAGETLKVFVRFPGQTTYTLGTARPAIASDGSFEWSRKTGKKTYVYFASEDESIKSGYSIIPAK